MATAMDAAVLKGKIYDATSAEPLIGALVTVDGSTIGTAADIDGFYTINLHRGKYTIISKNIGYVDMSQSISLEEDDVVTLDFAMTPDAKLLDEVSVTAMARQDTEAAQLRGQRASLLVQTGVSAQQISRSGDRDASEVVRRIPGVSIIDDKFIMVRGLSQRYNNVWLNGGAVPSSEADSRAFSFDILPSSQLDNMVIVKSPAPEYPADFTGGFIVINTRQLPETGSAAISLGVGVNDRTHFQGFLSPHGTALDFLGLGAFSRSLDAGMKGALNAYPGYESAANPRLDLLNNGLDNDWKVKRHSLAPDLKLNFGYSHKWRSDNGSKTGLLAAFNYSNTYKTLLDMENSLYGPYDISNNKEVPLRKATDNQYNNDVRIGAMLNLSFLPADSRHSFDWKNIFNIIAKERYSERVGINAQPDNINNMEYLYSSRTTYNTQFTGIHNLDNYHFDWSAGYAYANRDLPDRRLIERTDRTNETMGIYRISREFTYLAEHIASANLNYRCDFSILGLNPVLKSGAFAQYRTRSYNTRQFQYGWQPENTLPDGFLFDPDVQGNVLIDSNYGPDKLYLYEEVNYLNNYAGNQTQIAGYVGLDIPYRNFDFYAGVRYEYNNQVLKMNTLQYQESLHNTTYRDNDFFPSLNITYRLPHSQQLRLAYGKSVNRPEFRELSTSVYYDFDLGSNVMGNYDLKTAYIHNLDFRYEWYPSDGEQVSVALFYKHFLNPIEWTYTVAGGTDLIYSFVNAREANNYGIELDVRKSLDFIGLRYFSLSFNGSIIKSKVNFDGNTNNIDRPMQGQSPYLINAGVFYNNRDKGWTASLLYNRIGKRIIGVGNRYGTGSDGSARNIPNSYEMPRNTIDLSAAKRFGKWELKLALRDILAERYVFKQFEDVEINGEKRTIEETTRSFRPGRNFSLSITYNF